MKNLEFLKVENYFDFEKHPFEHQSLFFNENVETVVDALNCIGEYCEEWLCKVEKNHPGLSATPPRGNTRDVPPKTGGEFKDKKETFLPDKIIGEDGGNFVFVENGAKIIGGVFDLTNGSVYIGKDADVQGAWICGPVIIGEKTVVRPGAYLRGNVIIGKKNVIRGEIKNSVIMDDSDFPHPSYLGDSICGYKSHFGNQATAANVNIFGGKDNIKISVDGQKIDLGRRKVGIIMGDYCQVGCNSVSDPGTFLLPRTIVYSLSRIKSGVYGPNEILKNKPLEHGVIERAKLKLT